MAPSVNGRYAVVDLASEEVEERDLPEDYGSPVSGVLDAVDMALRERKDAFAIGSGLLTSSFVPAACGGFVRRFGGETPDQRMCVLTGNIAVELKLAGFDFLALDGVADEPGYLWVRDGIAEFVRSPGLAACDSWERTDAIRSEQGDRKIQTVSVGPWGDRAHPSSQLVMNYWGGEDKGGLASEFGKRRLLAVAFRGMGEIELEDPEGHFNSSKDLQAEHIARLGGSHGLSSFCEEAASDEFERLRHRVVGCFGCLFPCRTFYKISEDPKTMRLENREPGYLIYDIPAVERFMAHGLSAREAISTAADCARRGVEPVSLVDSLVASGSGVNPGAIGERLGAFDSVAPAAEPLARSFGQSFEGPGRFELCVALGLCPRYWARVGMEVEKLSRVVQTATGRALEL